MLPSKKVLKKINLIVLDLDGTLLDNNGAIGSRTLMFVSELKKKNVLFSFASGRLHSALTEYADILGISTPLISLDGCLIKSYPAGEQIFHSYVPEKYVQKAIDFADNYLVKLALCHEDAIYYTEHNASISNMLEKFGVTYTEVDSYDNYKAKTLEIIMAGDYKDTMLRIQNKMSFPHSFGLSTNFYKSHHFRGIYYLDIRKKGSTKGTGLVRLAKHLGVKIKHTAVLGDWYNDRELFETDAFKVTVANAVPEIKRKADFITSGTNNEDGVAEFLEMVLFAKS
ncbi:MAG: HAD family hydrolase [bacterium]